MEREQRLIVALVVIVISLVGVRMVLGHIMYAKTESVGYNWFWIVEAPASIERDDYVVFPLESSLIPEGMPPRVVKRVGCDSGQRLEATEEKGVYCDGAYLGKAKSVSMKGQPLTAFSFEGAVPSHSFFAVGTHKDSYDSRYFGFVSKTVVESRAYPLY